MKEIDNISSILDAVNEINLKPKKKFNILSQKNFIPKLNQNLLIPLDVDNIIKEAEEYKKKIINNTSQIDLTLNKKETSKIKDFDKVFFDLKLKIKDLEKKLTNLELEKKQSLTENILILEDEVLEPSKVLDKSMTDLTESLSKDNNALSLEVVTSLKIQDDTIRVLKEQIKKFKHTEDKLRLQLLDLEQDKSILLKKVPKFTETNNYKTFVDITKQNLKSIYNHVENQKKIFTDLKKNLIKNEYSFFFYKENYENLIIENNEIKKKLSNTKQQVEAFEEIKKELVLTFKNFNNVLSKNSIIKLNESFSKITTKLVSSDNYTKK
jgi:hypothetical protein